MRNMTYDLKPLWVEILKVYSEFRKICERHDLRFCAAYGTVLGALRHKGFIPWDDDFDLFMPRPDYDKFIEFARNEAPSYLRVVTYETDAEYDRVWVTFRNMREDLLERTRQASNIDVIGIYIDVFPLDGLPSSWWGAQWFRLKVFLLQAARRSLCADKPHVFSMSMLKCLCGRFVRFFYPPAYGNKEFLRKIDALYRRLPYDGSSIIGFAQEVVNHDGKMWRFRRELIGMPRNVPFEDINLPVPEKAELFLTGFYGNWKRLPPANKRRPAHVRKCK